MSTRWERNPTIRRPNSACSRRRVSIGDSATLLPSGTTYSGKNFFEFASEVPVATHPVAQRLAIHGNSCAASARDSPSRTGANASRWRTTLPSRVLDASARNSAAEFSARMISIVRAAIRPNLTPGRSERILGHSVWLWSARSRKSGPA